MRDRNAPLDEAALTGLAWAKMGGLLPAVVQDDATGDVLMLGYMSREALEATLHDRRATFHSRSKGRLWQKGESSGHFLAVKSIAVDCDGDALLVRAEPAGATCHLGSESCFSSEESPGLGWLGRLSRIVKAKCGRDPDESYTARLLREGPERIAKKVGEEGVELALAGACGGREACIQEAADLVYHLIVLMEARGFNWADVATVLRKRHAD